MQAIELEAAIP